MRIGTDEFDGKVGAALPMVLGIVLAVSLVLTSLTHLPGGVRRIAVRLEREQQEIYDGESALLARMEHLPEGYFDREPWNLRLPRVAECHRGPWRELTAGRVHVLAGAEPYEMSRRELLQMGEDFSKSLDESILNAPFLTIKSGNRRMMGPARSMSLYVQDGDLLVDLDGSASVGNFKSSGSLTVRGTAGYDTLRLYSSGPMSLSGHVTARWLEAYSADRIEVRQDFAFSGVIISRAGVDFRDKSRGFFPAVAFSLGQPLDSGEVRRAGRLPQAPYPAFTSGNLQPFEWSIP